MKIKNPLLPGRLAHAMMTLLAFLTAVCILALMMTGLMYITMTDRSMHESLAVTEANIDYQSQRIQADLSGLSERYGFDPSAFLPLIDREALISLNRDAIAWWMALPAGDALVAAPTLNQDAVVELLLADEQFKQAQPSGKAKTIARDEVSVAILNAVQNAILPIRANLIPAGLKLVSGKIDFTRYTAAIPSLPILFAACSLLLIALTILTGIRRPVRGFAFVGCGIAAGGLLGLLVLAAGAILNIPGTIAMYNPYFGQMIGAWLARMGLYLGIIGVICLMLGGLLIALHQRKMTHLRRS